MRVGKRTKARECAFQMLYQWDMTRETMERVSNMFWKVRSGTDNVKDRAEQLARGAQRDLRVLDAEITKASTNWRLDRVAAVDRNILRLAAFELLREQDTPASVVIDEAVEMAKRFGEADSPAFVNGVLDAVRRSVRGGEREKPRDKPARRPKRPQD